MRSVGHAVVGISLLFLGAAASWADGTVAPTASPTGVKAESTPAKGDASAAKSDVAAIKTAIVGKWRSVDDGEVMEFNADGSARIIDPNAAFVATYGVLDDGTLRINVPVFAKNSDFLYKLEVKGDEMTLTLKDRQPRKYLRIK